MMLLTEAWSRLKEPSWPNNCSTGELEVVHTLADDLDLESPIETVTFLFTDVEKHYHTKVSRGPIPSFIGRPTDHSQNSVR